jgi:leucyl aminopeptidase
MQVAVTKRASFDSQVDLFAVPTPMLDSKKSKLPNRWAGIDRWVRGSLRGAIETGDFQGKKGQSLLLYGAGKGAPTRVLLIGLGGEDDAGPDDLRKAGSQIVAEAVRRGGQKVAILAPAGRRLGNPSALQALAEGAVLGDYRYDQYQTGPGKAKPVRKTSILLDSGELRPARSAAAAGVVLAESQNLARDLSNQPPCDLNPVSLARNAQKVARETGMRCRVLDEPALRKLKMGAMLAVAQGSANPPRLIVMEHNPPKRGQKTRRPTVCLVGKGVTFDSGGLSLKPSGSMVTMKHDMSGGATVIGAMRACALLRIPLHVVGIIGAVENMPSSTAYRPDDVVTSAAGQTVEIGNTDAEGRLVLADALHYARMTFKPAAMVDVATLTGACVIALGKWCAGVLGNNDGLATGIRSAGEETGERFWQLPLWDDHRRFMKSHIADIKQVGGREAGTITAAAFLSHFVGDTPWAHLDIAGVANTDRAEAGQPRGATGFGVRALVQVLKDWKKVSL